MNFPINNDVVTPTINFGDGNSGFHERLDNAIDVTIAGADRFEWSGNVYASRTLGGGAMHNGAGSATDPQLTFAGDDSMGFGRSSADVLSIITNATQAIEIDATQDVTFPAGQVAINQAVDNDISLAVTAVPEDIGLLNGDFASNLDNWVGAEWAFDSGTAKWTFAGGAATLTQTAPTALVNGHRYKITFNITAVTGSGGVTVTIPGDTTVKFTAIQEHTDTLVASGAGALTFTGSGVGGTCNIDNVTIFDLDGIAIDVDGSVHATGGFIQDTPAFPGSPEQAIAQIKAIKSIGGRVDDSTLGWAMARIRNRVEQDFADAPTADDWLTTQAWHSDGRFLRSTTAPLRLLTFFDDSGDTSQTVALRRAVANKLTRDIPTSCVLTLSGDNNTTWTLADDVTTQTLVYDAGLDEVGVRLRASYVTYHHNIGRGVNRLDAAVRGLSAREKQDRAQIIALKARVATLETQAIDFKARLQALEGN